MWSARQPRLSILHTVWDIKRDEETNLSQNALLPSAQFRMFSSQTGCVDKIEKERSKQVDSETQWASLARQLRQNITILQGMPFFSSTSFSCPVRSADIHIPKHSIQVSRGKCITMPSVVKLYQHTDMNVFSYMINGGMDEWSRGEKKACHTSRGVAAPSRKSAEGWKVERLSTNRHQKRHRYE